MDKDESQTEKRPSRPADRPDSRQTEMDARYQEGVVWRNSVRTEDLEWRKAARREDGEVREASRREDREWRELTRKEDKEWREVMRREDLEWRAEVRSDDQQHRLRTERTAKRCAALAAAAQASKAGSPLDAILALARQLEDWLNTADK